MPSTNKPSTSVAPPNPNIQTFDASAPQMHQALVDIQQILATIRNELMEMKPILKGISVQLTNLTPPKSNGNRPNNT